MQKKIGKRKAVKKCRKDKKTKGCNFFLKKMGKAVKKLQKIIRKMKGYKETVEKERKERCEIAEGEKEKGIKREETGKKLRKGRRKREISYDQKTRGDRK